MKELLRSVVMAFSMFSVIPTPRVAWKEGNMRFMLAALPLVGAVIGLALWGYLALCALLHFHSVLTAAGLTLLPLVLSGGIHLDGFMDTADALGSRAEPEKKRAILKDPHAGAFAVIALSAYLLLYAACCTELPATWETACFLGLTHVAARASGALLGVVVPPWSGQGLLRTFHDASARSACYLLGVWLLLSGAALVILHPAGGGAAVAAAALCFFAVWRISKKQFGGMSGDLAGFLITLTELMMLLAYLIAERAVAI